MQPAPEISIVVLCYKAGNFVETVVTDIEHILKPAQVNYELILVANYDDDKDVTPTVAQKISESNSRVTALTNLKKGKMGWDMRSGLDVATGKYVAVIDGDGQMPVSDLIAVYKLMKTGHFDLVKTFREERHDGFQRKLISTIFNYLFSILFSPQVKIRDVNAKPKIITREALHTLRLESDDWFTDAEIMIQAVKLNWRIHEIPTVFYKNPTRGSFVNWMTVIEFFLNLISYKWKEIKHKR